MVNRQMDTPNLRFPKLKSPLRWEDEIVGAYMTIEHGLGGKSDLNFEQCKVDQFDIEPAEGGRFTLTFRVMSDKTRTLVERLCARVKMPRYMRDTSAARAALAKFGETYAQQSKSGEQMTRTELRRAARIR